MFPTWDRFQTSIILWYLLIFWLILSVSPFSDVLNWNKYDTLDVIIFFFVVVHMQNRIVCLQTLIYLKIVAICTLYKDKCNIDVVLPGKCNLDLMWPFLRLNNSHKYVYLGIWLLKYCQIYILLNWNKYSMNLRA